MTLADELTKMAFEADLRSDTTPAERKTIHQLVSAHRSGMCPIVEITLSPADVMALSSESGGAHMGRPFSSAEVR